MNWGNKIAIFYSIFAISMLSAVIFASMQNFHLVSENYYQEEIAYENRIQEIRNTQSLDADLSWEYQKGEGLRLNFPSSSNLIKGNIHFYRPSDAQLDQKFPIQLSNQQQFIPTETFAQGNWKVQVSWMQDGKNFFKEIVLSL